MAKKEVRLGIIGCSQGTHGKVWAEMLSKEEGRKYHMRPYRIWDADADAAETVAKSTGATYVKDFREAGEDVDGILITELFPERYFELSRPFLEAGKRIFFNRPFAGSIADAQEIIRLAQKHGAKIYSASCLFHTKAASKARQQLPEIVPIRLFSMIGRSDHVSFYLPHAIAALISVLGVGVCRVQALSLHCSGKQPHLVTAPVMVYVEYSPDAYVGAARGVVQMIGPESKWHEFQLKLFGADKESDEIRFESKYDLLLETMADFLRTGIEPVPHRAILEKTAIYHAALQSAREDGRIINIIDTIG